MVFPRQPMRRPMRHPCRRRPLPATDTAIRHGGIAVYPTSLPPSCPPRSPDRSRRTPPPSPQDTEWHRIVSLNGRPRADTNATAMPVPDLGARVTVARTAGCATDSARGFARMMPPSLPKLNGDGLDTSVSRPIPASDQGPRAGG
ncbi:hypothetical protein CHELA17_62709 [Chelatococcus asaccharovorans]|nr:hypothetical protein CHELA17_62709 [Chelatococcus asaccharovorans]